MANTKKYVSLDKLGLYDEKIKKVISDSDATTLASAKQYFEDNADRFDVAGAAATAESNAKAYADGKDAAIQAAQAAADKAQGEVDALELLVGTLPSGTSATSVVDYVNVKTSGIATDAALGELNNQVSGLQTAVNGIAADYLKAADKTELNNAIAAEAARADAAEKANAANIKAIADDYLKAADKTELNNAIALKANQTALEAEAARADAAEKANAAAIKAIADDYLKAADKTELQGNIDAVSGAVERLTNGVSAEEIDGVNELIQYVKDHGAEVTGMQEDIKANADAIAAIPQADWNQNDPEAADYVKNRTHYEDIQAEYLLQDIPMSSMTSGSMGAGYIEYPDGVVPTLEEGKTYYLNFNGDVYSSAAVSNGRLVFQDIRHPDGSDRMIQISLVSDSIADRYEIETLYCYNYYYDWENSDITFSVYSGTIDIKQLDEKFIPDTIARVAEVDAVAGRMTTAEGKITAVEGAVATKVEQSVYDAKVAELAGADTAMAGRLDAIEAQLGDGEGSVADLIAEAKQEAIDAAASDATSKANTAEANAKGHADGLNTAMNARVEALEAIDHDHSNKALLDTYTQTEANLADAVAKKHEHANKTVLDGITAENVTTWNTVTSKAAQADLNAVDGRVTAIETWHANFVEVSEEEINALFA